MGLEHTPRQIDRKRESSSPSAPILRPKSPALFNLSAWGTLKRFHPPATFGTRRSGTFD